MELTYQWSMAEAMDLNLLKDAFLVAGIDEGLVLSVDLCFGGIQNGDWIRSTAN